MSVPGPKCGCHPWPVTGCVFALALCGWACWETASAAHRRETIDVERLHSLALPNLHRLTPRIYSGGTPQGDAGLLELAALGIRTVISVDGETPQADAAAKLGLRYVHLPIGYDSVPRKRIVELLAAVQSLPTPVYIHCHRGLHRGPAAAVAICRLVADLDAAAAEKLLEDLGTARKYPGLYASVENITPVTTAELRQHPANRLPSIAKVPPLVEQMVAIEAHWEQLSKRLETATEWDDGLKADYVVFEERVTEAIRSPYSVSLLNWWDRSRRRFEYNPARSPTQTRQAVQEACNSCHERFRDQPQ